MENGKWNFKKYIFLKKVILLLSIKPLLLYKKKFAALFFLAGS